MKQSWNQAGWMLEWRALLSTSTASGEAEGELPHCEKMHQKKENEGRKNPDEKHKLCITLSDLPLKMGKSACLAVCNYLYFAED